MLCPHCRMDTRTTDACEWCKKPIASAREVTKQVRMSLTGEVVEVESTAQVAVAPHVPVAGGMPPVARMSARAAGLPTQAVTAEFVRGEMTLDDTDVAARWDRALALIFPVLALSLLITHYAPDALTWLAFADCFLVALALGATRAIASFDEAFLDCTGVLIVSYFFGPIAGFGAYFVAGLVKQEWNGALFAVLLSHVLIRLMYSIAFQDSAPLWLTVIPYIQIMSVFGFISFLSVCLSFAGWMFSNFFRPVNE